MADIQVHCGSCGNAFKVTEDMAGLIATCPKCELQISVPLSDGIRESRPKLQIKREGTLAGGKRCPACDGSMSAEAVICIQCGYDTRTGKNLAGQSEGLKLGKPIFALLGVVILGGIVWSLTRSRSESQSLGGPLSEPAKPSVTTPATPPDQSAAPVPTPSSVVAEIANEPSDESAIAEEEMEKGPSLEEVQQKLTAALNARHPMYTPGSAVVLRRLNGLVHRGELVLLGADFVTIQTEDGQVQVPFDSLDRQTRMLCDAEFRSKYVEHRSRQALPFAETF